MKRFLVAGALFLLICISYVVYVRLTLPDIQTLRSNNPRTTAMMEQRAGERGTAARPLRSWTDYKNISPHLRNAVLIAEDAAFFQHSGFDMAQIRESIKRNLRERRLARGASTITQQLAKNLYLSTSRNPLRKIRELMIARRMEDVLSKQRIFEIYLNVIEWGDGIYGITAASQKYFGKRPADLLPEEAAVLSAMIPNPRRYSPERNLRFLERRKGQLLNQLVQYRFLTRDEYDAAKVRPVVFLQPSGVR
jgi:monofunctional biosynthetic peptidoglycan transglycosylase